MARIRNLGAAFFRAIRRWVGLTGPGGEGLLFEDGSGWANWE